MDFGFFVVEVEAISLSTSRERVHTVLGQKKGKEGLDSCEFWLV